MDDSPTLFGVFRFAERTVVDDLATFQPYVRCARGAHVGIGNPVPALAQGLDPVERLAQDGLVEIGDDADVSVFSRILRIASLFNPACG